MAEKDWDHLRALIEINAAFAEGVTSHYKRIGLQYVDVPEVVGITGACENVDTLFKVGNRLGIPLYITQTGQLALEQALQRFPGVYTVIHSGRDEELEDDRHLRQFRLIEEEFDWTLERGREPYDEERMFELLLSHIERAIKAGIAGVLEESSATLRQYFGRNPNALSEILIQPFLRISYEEAITLLRKNGFPALRFGDDLKASHEQRMVELVNKRERRGVTLPVFIARYPKEIKFFNMKVAHADERVVLSCDLIFPVAGEGVGAAVREHDGERLKERLLGSRMFALHKERGGGYREFAWYVDGIVGAGKTNPHAGYGVGSERVIQYILGLPDIRRCSILHLLAAETGDWREAVEALNPKG